MDNMFDSIAMTWALACNKARCIWLDAVKEIGEKIDERSKALTEKPIGWWPFITFKANDIMERRKMNNELNNSDGGAEMYDLITEWCKSYFLDDNTRINLDREFESSEFVDWVEVKESCS